MVSPALFGQLEYGHLARASSLCGACREACPVDIDLPKLLLRIRAGIEVSEPSTKNHPNAPTPLAIGLKLFTFAASSPRRFAAAQWLAGVVGSLATFFSRGDPWMHLPGLTGWGYSKDFPSPAARTFRSRFRKYSKGVQVENNRGALSAETYFVSPIADETIVTQGHLGMEKFKAEMEILGGNFTLCSSDTAVIKILEILRAKGLDQLLTWEAPYLPEEVLEKLSREGIQIIHPSAETLETSSLVQGRIDGRVCRNC